MVKDTTKGMSKNRTITNVSPRTGGIFKASTHDGSFTLKQNS